MGSLRKLHWEEKLNKLGVIRWECYDREKYIGKVTYHPEESERPWWAFIPGVHGWETVYLHTKEEAMEYVVKPERQNVTSPHTVKPSSFHEYLRIEREDEKYEYGIN